MRHWILFFICLGPLFTSAQQSDTLSFPPKADTTDVNSIGAIVSAYYDVLQGEAGARDWDRFRSLFLPTARIDAVNYNQQGRVIPRLGTLEDYIRNSDAFFRRTDYYPREVTNKVQYYGHLAQVFSSYYASTYFAGQGLRPKRTNGVACFQLIFFEGRWWISNLVWNAEKRNQPVPARLD